MSESEVARLRAALEAIRAKILAGELTGHVGSPGAPLYIDKQTLLTDFIDRALAPPGTGDAPERNVRLAAPCDRDSRYNDREWGSTLETQHAKVDHDDSAAGPV
jgi:hypothetical protein